MRRGFRRLLGPTSVNPIIAQKQVILNAVLFGVAIPFLIFGIISLILWSMQLAPAGIGIVAFAALPFFILAYFLGRKDHIRLAGFIPTVIIFLVVITSSAFQVNLGQVSIIGFAIIVSVAGSLMGLSAAIVFTLLGILTYALAGWAQINGLLPAPLVTETPAITNIFGLALGLSLLVV
ncbi:MAG: hypothetical protein E4G99_12840, partial [Anaerolineales bacterium]